MSEGLIFLHVDEPGGLASILTSFIFCNLEQSLSISWFTDSFFLAIDTGKGVLYTSDSDGIVFGESLQNHVVCLLNFLLSNEYYILKHY